MTFYMPMIVLAIRMEVEVIFKNSYPEFFAEDTQEKIAMKLINDLITQLIDPNIFYSRFSFFESGREAINIKYGVSSQAEIRRSSNVFVQFVESEIGSSWIREEQILHQVCFSSIADPEPVGRQNQGALWNWQECNFGQDGWDTASHVGEEVIIDVSIQSGRG